MHEERGLYRNGVGAAVTVNGIAVPMDSFVNGGDVWPRSYAIETMNGIPLGPRSWRLLNTPIAQMLRDRAVLVST
jgi:hypothetical protein